MSGIAGIVNFDGAPVDDELLKRMTRAISYRGPDALETWSEGQAGFGHTMLRATDEAEFERQPCTLEGRYWITADVRVDARDELIAALEGAGESVREGVTDPELLLHSYRAWGSGMMTRIIGDFAFAIWDREEQRLFAARDQMGVKFFYYHTRGPLFVFSNTLNCVRLHPSPTNELNERAIGDFLICGHNADPATTTFADIQALPAAHTLTATAGGVSISRYWSIPLPHEIRFRDKREYVERFKELLEAAVRDRIRWPSVSIAMSGGLDSTAIAAVAKKILNQRGESGGVLAATIVLGDVGEEHYAQIAADALGIPLLQVNANVDEWLTGGRTAALARPEPVADATLTARFEFSRIAGDHGRSYLTGHDADSLLSLSYDEYIADMRKRRAYGELARVAFDFVRVRRRFPRLVTWRRAVARNEQESGSAFPEWIEPGFARRLGLRERLAEIWSIPVPAEYRLRKHAYYYLTLPSWRTLFTLSEPGVTGVPVEPRHVFLDQRLIQYCMGLPQVPWLLTKHIERESMRGVLPRRILSRPKTGVPVPLDRIPARDSEILNPLLRGSEIRSFVVPELVDLWDGSGNAVAQIRAPILANWLDVNWRVPRFVDRNGWLA